MGLPFEESTSTAPLWGYKSQVCALHVDGVQDKWGQQVEPCRIKAWLPVTGSNSCCFPKYWWFNTKDEPFSRSTKLCLLNPFKAINMNRPTVNWKVMALCAGNQWSWNFKCTKPSETMGSTESWWAGVVQPPFVYAVNADAVGWFWRNKTAEMHRTVEWPKGPYPENLTGVWGSQHFSVTNVNLFGY